MAPEFDVTSKKSKLYHEKGIAQRLTAAAGRTTATDAPTQLFVVRVHRDEFTLSVDSSGELLHRRGYRQETAKAPAARDARRRHAARRGMGRASAAGGPDVRLGHDPDRGGADRAMHRARPRARVRLRGVAVVRRGRGGGAVHERAGSEVLARSPVPILGSDRDAGAVAAARENAARAGVATDVTFVEAPLSAIAPPAGPGFLVSNPPYGVRVGEEARLRDLYATLGRLVTQRLDGWTVALLTANPRLDHATGLDWREVLRTSNGGIPVRLIVHPAI